MSDLRARRPARPTRPARRPSWHPAPSLVALIVALVVGAPAAGAQEGGIAVDGEPCTDGVGVTVVVDFQELGDDTVLVRCAPEAPVDGFAALEQAGIPYRTTVAFPGFLCRIADRPDDDPCATSSPARAYWSYWLAPAGGEWCFSNYGAGNRTPPPGAVEGWSFALDRTTEDVPPPRVAPPPPPDGTEAHPLGETDCTTAAASAGATDPVSTTDPPPAVGQGDPVDLDAAADDGGGSPVGLLVAVAAVGTLVAVAVVISRRRAGRRSPPELDLHPDVHDVPGTSCTSGGPGQADDSIWARPTTADEPPTGG